MGVKKKRVFLLVCISKLLNENVHVLEVPIVKKIWQTHTGIS